MEELSGPPKLRQLLGGDVELAGNELILRLTGGGGFFDGSFPWGATAPFLALSVYEDGISLGWRWGKSAARAPHFKWDELIDLQLSRTTASWYDRERFFYRFVSLVDGSMDRLGDVLDQRDVSYTIVSGSWMRPFTMK